MSYTSKFTGEEIDNLLSNLNNGAMFELFNGRADVVNQEYSLSESIENFDILLVQGQHSTCADITVLPIFVSTIKENYNSTYAIDARAFTDKAMDTTAAAKIRIKFKDNKTFYPSLIAFSGWTISPAITKIVGIKFFSSTLGASTSNPIGSILPIMGTEAPQDYLVCDGRELQISEYKELADYFEKQFGDNGYFGGDGIKTFKLPDLRNEFLRGYGNLSGEIGIHQDATKHVLQVVTNSNNQIQYRSDGNESHTSSLDRDEEVKTSVTKLINATFSYQPGTVNNEKVYYTSRPTNVAVLFCIKYTEGASGINVSENYSTEETKIGTWIDGKPLYQKTFVEYTIENTSSSGALSYTLISVSDLNIENVIDLSGIVNKTGVGAQPLPVFWGSTSYGVQAYYRTSDNTIAIKNSAIDYNGSKVNIVIKYTKTTD